MMMNLPKESYLTPYKFSESKTSSLKYCYAARSWLTAEPEACLELDLHVAQGLADLLPMILCGEVSAELAFEHALQAFCSKLYPDLYCGIKQIIADEKRHAEQLYILSKFLPSPNKRDTAKLAVHFLRSLVSQNLSIHLVRLSALDIGVCVVLSTLCSAIPINENKYLSQLFTSIRRDEGRHVRITRHCTVALGIDANIEKIEKIKVLKDFSALLSTQDNAFMAIGVCPEHLRACFVKRCDLISSEFIDGWGK